MYFYRSVIIFIICIVVFNIIYTVVVFWYNLVSNLFRPFVRFYYFPDYIVIFKLKFPRGDLAIAWCKALNHINQSINHNYAIIFIERVVMVGLNTKYTNLQLVVSIAVVFGW